MIVHCFGARTCVSCVSMCRWPFHLLCTPVHTFQYKLGAMAGVKQEKGQHPAASQYPSCFFYHLFYVVRALVLIPKRVRDHPFPLSTFRSNFVFWRSLGFPLESNLW